MADGLYVWNAAGVLVFTSERPFGGGVVGTYTQAKSGVAGTITYWNFDGTDHPDIGLSSVRAIQVGAGLHTWDVVGAKQIKFTERTARAGLGISTRLIVFAK